MQLSERQFNEFNKLRPFYSSKKITKVIDLIWDDKLTLENFWDDARKVTKAITSDHSIKEWQIIFENVERILKMSLEVLYPVVYALESVEKVVGHDYFSEPITEVIGYKAKKAYLVKKSTYYYKDREPRELYTVVFADEDNNFVKPSMNYDGECYNGVVKDKIFESLKLAEIEAGLENIKQDLI